MRDDTIQGFDLALFSAGGGDVARVGAAVRRRPARSSSTTRRAWRMHDDVPLVVTEVNPDALDAPPGHRREPELHDDGRDAAAQGAARRVRPARDGRDELPGRRRRRAEGHRRARRAGRAARRGRRPARQRRRRRAAQGRSRASTPTRSRSTSCRCSARSATRATPTRSSSSRTSRARSSRSPASRSRRRACACRSWSATRSPCRATFERDARPRRGERGARGVPEPRRPGGADAARVGRPRRGRRRPRARATSATRHALNLFVVGDNLLKGAALNTVQIAEELHERDLVRPAEAALLVVAAWRPASTLRATSCATRGRSRTSTTAAAT